MQKSLQLVMNTKSETIQIRLSTAEKEGFEQCAKLAGIPLSSWVRERLRLTAIRELENAGQSVPFVKPFKIEGIE